MSVLARSVGNAFRNKVRTAAVVAVLAVAIGLALAMLVANQAVGAKVQELNASVGTVLTVNPAGGQGFEGGGEPLTAGAGRNGRRRTQRDRRRRNQGAAAAQRHRSSRPDGGRPDRRPGRRLGRSRRAVRHDADHQPHRRRRRRNARQPQPGQRPEPPVQREPRSPCGSLPITATGIGAEVDSTGKALELTEGTGLGDYTAASTKALLGTTLAEKNNLTVGSTFTINSTRPSPWRACSTPARRSATTPST